MTRLALCAAGPGNAAIFYGRVATPIGLDQLEFDHPIVDEDEIHGDAASWRMTAVRHLGDYGAAMPWSGDVVPPVGEPLRALP